MKNIRPHSLGMILGIQLAGWHIGWSFLVWMGWAQSLIDFILGMYMVAPALHVAAFNAFRAVQLIVLAGCAGYSIGLSAAMIWNLFVTDGPEPNGIRLHPL